MAQFEGPICCLCRAVEFQVCSADIWACSGDCPGFRKHFFCIVKSSQFISLKSMKAYIWSKGIALLILKFGTRWAWVVSITHQPLYPCERNPGTHWIEGWWAPKTILTTWKRENSLTCARIRTLSHPGRRLITILIILSRIPFLYSENSKEIFSNL